MEPIYYPLDQPFWEPCKPPQPKCYGSEKALDNDIDCYGCNWFDQCINFSIKLGESSLSQQLRRDEA